ncbi:MAG TPA: oxygen-independent coproporphyrinogen III oxidase [Vitreimonas sp.]|uniref:oxygen-independent coproporphyrinogen III oxidase n=1 Tax=Vitreimonas sp. TaxID=3069702 RepID=UPI002D586A5E|nr:oxygen-independent coproporphyrinogen III oxidase [Vitreimonas sp.]HYD89292.1 oxygen-independent coproporphyrinogen III oxidase [Vitreimonas sp.]
MDPRLLAHAERQAPRYTSYPTAPHFAASVDGAVHAGWLRQLDADAPIGFYLHVPYCRELCWYCGCNTYAARREEPLADYVQTLLREIDLVGEQIATHRVVDIHWGGGTPNILSPEQFTRICHHLAFWFDIAPQARHSIEIDPRHLTPALAAAYREAGVTRASIGAQDFNPHVQRAMGRIQPAELVQGAMTMLREAGIAQINIDLMYGLPAQSSDDVLRSVQTATAMRPSRVALFGYAHVPWFKKRQRLIDETQLANAAERLEHAEIARLELARLGYVAIGLDHFALPDDELTVAARNDTLRRSFQGYDTSTTAATIGLGPSAISTLPQGYAQNASEVGAWSRVVADERLPIARGHALDDEDRRRGALIEQIMCDFTGDLGPLGGASACVRELATLAPMTRDGLVVVSGDIITLPAHARPLCRIVAQAFDSYAEKGAARHSAAV